MDEGGNSGLKLFSLHRDKGYPNPTLCCAKDGAPRVYIPFYRDVCEILFSCSASMHRIYVGIPARLERCPNIT